MIRYTWQRDSLIVKTPPHGVSRVCARLASAMIRSVYELAVAIRRTPMVCRILRERQQVPSPIPLCTQPAMGYSATRG